jgi:dTDP-L-rhamnose 4-epimerase
MKKILITGGAGFIGSFVADELLRRKFKVRAFDKLARQVHGRKPGRPRYLDRRVELVRGDVKCRKDVAKALDGVDAVIHMAAAVGVGQSMYEIKRYFSENTIGGAVLLEEIVKRKKHIKKMIVASSMSIYGEGAYECPVHGVIYPRLRPNWQLEKREWEMKCTRCRREAKPVPTSEDKPLYPTSIYAITKRDHEEMFLSIGITHEIPTVALRYFNVYGERQALSNPYTGIGAIISSRLLNNNKPMIFEDGLQSRDFISVHDIARATVMTLLDSRADFEVFNVGTGRPTTIIKLARILAKKIHFKSGVDIVGKFRAGDIRHCYADISKIRKAIGFKPEIRVEDGAGVLIGWVKKQQAVDGTTRAATELEKHGLTR